MTSLLVRWQSAVSFDFLRQIILALALCLVAVSGLGIFPLYLAGVGAALTLLGLECRSECKWLSLYCFGTLAVMIMEPSLAHAVSLLALLLFFANRPFFSAALLLSQLPVLLSPFTPLSAGVLSPYVSGALFALFTTCCYRAGRRARQAVAVVFALYGAALLLTTFASWELSPVPTSATGAGYQIGAAIKKISGRSQSGVGQLIYNRTEYQPVVPTGALYLDHDAHTGWDDGNFYQQRPWGRNVLIAGEPLRMAARRDGILISNLGASLKKSTTHIIYGLMDEGSVVPLARNAQGGIILADSDFAVNGMAPYQSSLIRRITGTDTTWMTFHVTCAILLLLVPWYKRPWFLLIPLIACLPGTWESQQGEVRYEGRRCHWPHTELGEGVVRLLQDRGINARFGAEGARVLVVGSGYSAKLNQEKLVILEPGASVQVNGILYHAQELPLGDRDGIVDARALQREHIHLSSPIIRIDGVTIIATGTPTALEQKWFFDAL